MSTGWNIFRHERGGSVKECAAEWHSMTAKEQEAYKDSFKKTDSNASSSQSKKKQPSKKKPASKTVGLGNNISDKEVVATKALQGYVHDAIAQQAKDIMLGMQIMDTSQWEATSPSSKQAAKPTSVSKTEKPSAAKPSAAKPSAAKPSAATMSKATSSAAKADAGSLVEADPKRDVHVTIRCLVKAWEEYWPYEETDDEDIKPPKAWSRLSMQQKKAVYSAVAEGVDEFEDWIYFDEPYNEAGGGYKKLSSRVMPKGPLEQPVIEYKGVLTNTNWSINQLVEMIGGTFAHYESAGDSSATICCIEFPQPTQ
jgi:hypothetical protein